MAKGQEKGLEEKLTEFDEIIRKERKTKRFLFCPMCGSLNVKQHFYGLSDKNVAMSPQMDCVDCKFYGFMLRGTPEEILEYRKELRNRKK